MSSTRIILTTAQRDLLTAAADLIDEIGTASVAMAAERVGRRAADVRGDAQSLLNLHLVSRLQPTILILGAGWNLLGRMPRSPITGAATAAPEPVVEAAPPPTMIDVLRELVPTLPEPLDATALAARLGAHKPSVQATLSRLWRMNAIGRYLIDGRAAYGALNPPDASSVGTDPAGDAGPGVVEPLPVADDQAREGSACGETCPASEGSGDVDEAPDGDHVEELSGGGDAAAGALASESDPRRLRHPGRRHRPTGEAVASELEHDIAHRLQVAIHARGLAAVLPTPRVANPMPLHIYVATGLEHAHRARLVGCALRAAGHHITYDWTTHGSVQGEGSERLAEVAQAERDGVAVADLVIAILPGGRGTHVEIGMALGYGIPVALLIQNGCYDAECAFYSLPEIDRRAWSTLTELIDGAVGAAALVAAELDEGHVEGPDPFLDAELDEGHVEGPDPFLDAPVPDGVPQASVAPIASQIDTPVEATLRLELEQHVKALDEIRATLTNAGITPTAVTDTGTTTTLSTPTMTHMAAHELRRTHAQSGAAMRALQRIATAAGLPGGIELKHRDVEELVEHITERLTADPPSGTTVRTVLEAVSEASGFLLDWHADDAALVAQLPRLLEHLRRLASDAAIVQHAERHGDSAQDLVASLPALVELLLEYGVTVDPTTAPGGPFVHAVRRALSVSQDRGIALATTEGVVSELFARCQDYAEMARDLRAAASRIPSLAAAAADLEARIAVVRGAAAIVQAEVASA